MGGHSFSSSTSTCYELTNSSGTVVWSGSASGSASGTTQQGANSGLNSVMKALLLELLSKGLNSIYSTSTDCDWCGNTGTTTCGDCTTQSSSSTTTYTYEDTYTLSAYNCNDSSSTPSTIGFVYKYCVTTKGCSADYDQVSCKPTFCYQPLNYAG